MSTEPLYLRVIAAMEPGVPVPCSVVLERLADPALSLQQVRAAMGEARREGLVHWNGYWHDGQRLFLLTAQRQVEQGAIASWFLEAPK